jgi:cyclopropane fatty-acyl-phospholipid synthase-like methyltransferase
MEQRFTFNQVAELYDQARAAYPQALYDDLMEFANLSAGSAVLEIGCCAGKATEEFARHARAAVRRVRARESHRLSPTRKA